MSDVVLIEFASDALAEEALKRAGFSVGIRQRGAPRGILYGSYVISKWRNLDRQHREMLHGEMVRQGSAGTITVVTLKAESVPPTAIATLQEQAR
jgi:hypothetical protein